MSVQSNIESELKATKDRMPVRIMDFEIDPKLVRDALPELFPGYGISMTLPYLEPYLVRTMREALKHCTDPVVAQEVRQFIGQEAQHYRQHAVLNDMIRSISPELEGLREIEDQLEADYQRFTQTKSLKFNLAYAEGFEAATFAGGRANFRNHVFDRLETIQNTDLLRLFIWHALEEVEHSTVTFNIYDHLYGDYLYRLVAGTYGQYHFFKYVFLFSKFIAQNAPQAIEQGRALWPSKNLLGDWKEQLSLLGAISKVYLPGYNPAKMEIPENVAQYSKSYAEQARDIRVMVAR
ncbi:MAG: metal-dependent hydrolase [Pseudomonadales bacterium]|nr:metal-dependent hydrolase [Pseudomonadales bacterium]MBO6564642.1 metal-dependent hydrolase [Pseudomonadales bacterium]MBO6597228.1 metal-dependent hydrolase [Pseudomonadales bacterium]MBO6655266.1 metal-dependent hydrolase [Pseudomonadales bacterium]MBO6703857.1 metal-dependent hydrolase [Pseudomonadales bacterium]